MNKEELAAAMIATVKRLVERMEGRAAYLASHHGTASIHVQRDDLDAMRAVLARLEGLAAPGEWLPIETAPRDGMPFLWCTHNGEFAKTPFIYCVIRWPEYEDCFLQGHWMPLPKPPVTPPP